MPLMSTAGGINDPALGKPVEFVVTHRLNPFVSGVARFNDIMAEGLGVRVVGLFEESLPLSGTSARSPSK